MIGLVRTLPTSADVTKVPICASVGMIAAVSMSMWSSLAHVARDKFGSLRARDRACAAVASTVRLQ